VKVRVLPCQPHSLVFGGFEIQMLSAIDAVREAGVDAAPLDVWSRDGAFDILQLWGLEDAHLPAVTWGRQAGKRIVMSVLLPYLTPRTFARNLAGRMLGFKRIQRKMLPLVDRLVVVNREQAKTAEKLLGFPGDRISVIPNIVEEIYFDGGEPAGGSGDFGIENYLVCTGNICRRKNQLVLAQAAIEEGIPLLIVGRPLTGEEDYADALGKLIGRSANVRWVLGLPAHSPELRAAYRKSAGFVLVSADETQPISALEAAAMGKPLLLSDNMWARQSFYQGACLVNPFSLESVRDGMQRVMDQPDRFKVGPEELEQCRRRSVGEAYAKAYAQAMAGAA
jgi:glycosyltransferase involved in cell wall biosynthesis